MARCNIQIEFDRPDRKYRSGEELTGSLSLRADGDLKCRALTVEHYWQTHGKGNKDRGPERVILRVGNVTCRAGATHTYPFRMTAPARPLTYHGHYLNVDHYIRARADIPWAFDAKDVEEFIVLPGAMQPKGRVRLKRFEEGFFKSLWNAIVKQKLGDVTARLGASVMAPGGRLPLKIRFRPRKFVQLNRVTATLEGRERCVSGSGTNRTTHTHKLYKRTTVIATTAAQLGGDIVTMDGEIEIPDTTAYTFKADDNEIVWTVSLRIDVADWPDWRQSTTVEIRPDAPPVTAATSPPLPAAGATAAGGTQAAAEPTTDARAVADHIRSIHDAKREADDAPAPMQEPAISADEPASPSTDAPSAPPEMESPDPDPLARAIVKIAGADRFNGDRERLVEELVGTTFSFAAKVDRVDWTFSFDVAEPYRNGRTVVGRLSTSQASVLMRFTSPDNETVDAVKPTTEMQIDGMLSKWDNVHNRPEIDVTSFQVNTEPGPPR